MLIGNAFPPIKPIFFAVLEHPIIKSHTAIHSTSLLIQRDNLRLSDISIKIGKVLMLIQRYTADGDIAAADGGQCLAFHPMAFIRGTDSGGGGADLQAST